MYWCGVPGMLSCRVGNDVDDDDNEVDVLNYPHDLLDFFPIMIRGMIVKLKID